MRKETRKEYMQQYNRSKKDLMNKLKEKVRMQELKISELEATIQTLKEFIK
jgi:hypothetical protein